MDLIDERNRKEKMAKSIIKRRNVIFTAPQELKEEEPEHDEMAQEILERLERERQNDEDKKRMEIERLIAEQEKKLLEVNRILNEKQELLEKTMQEAITDDVTMEEAILEKLVKEEIIEE